MLIVDAQVHIWSGGKPGNVSHRQVDAFTAEDVLAEMDAAGVNAAVIHPPTSWDANANELAVEAAKAHPDRFAILGNFTLKPENQAVVETWKQRPGMVGFRFSFTGAGESTWFTDGTADWLWPAAEKAGLPIALLAGRSLPKLAQIAEQHPGLRLLIDHLGAPPGVRGDGIWSNLPALTELARFPNVAIKATGAPSYSSQPYPHRDIHEPLRRLFDAYGPRRLFWGTDITRMSDTWRQCVTLFTEELPWLSDDDKELVMGRAVCDWLDWQPAAPA
jgi:predicted TIM-barrel fold metal-dependent hydrolase